MALRADASAVVAGHFPGYAAIYAAHGWRIFPGIERVYVNAKARDALGWRPRHDLGTALARLAAGEETVSPLARRIGTKGYPDGEVAGRPSPLRSAPPARCGSTAAETSQVPSGRCTWAKLTVRRCAPCATMPRRASVTWAGVPTSWMSSSERIQG